MASNKTIELVLSHTISVHSLLLCIRLQGPLILMINVTLVAFILRRSGLRRKHNNILLANLLLSHSMEGLLVISLAFELDKGHYEQHMPIIFSSITLLNLLNILPVTMERLVAIRWPFLHAELNIKKIYIFSCIPWVFVVAYTTIAISVGFTNTFADLLTMAFISLLLIVLAIANVMIYRVVRRQTEALKKTCVESPPPQTDISC